MNIKLDFFPKVSIILPTYNGDEYISQSIDSCLNQTYKNIELIIVDDGSSDETSDIIKSYQDERIRYFRHETNKGLAHSLNTGFANATGEYLTWTSDDNFYSHRAIESMVKILQKNKKIGFVYTNFYLVNEESRIVQYRCVASASKLYLWNCVGACFLYRRKVYEEVGEYNPRAFLFEDHEYWLRIRKKFQMKKLDKYLYSYRVHKESLSHYRCSLAEQDIEKRNEIIEKTKEKCVSLAERYHLYAEKYFRKGDRLNTRKLVMKSLLLNPFLNLEVWKLLLTVFLNPIIVRRIRKTWNAILRVKMARGNEQKE